jgi:hypothetical protein
LIQACFVTVNLNPFVIHRLSNFESKHLVVPAVRRYCFTTQGIPGILKIASFAAMAAHKAGPYLVAPAGIEPARP